MTKKGKYKVVRQDFTLPCEHPMCEVLHKNKRLYEWIGYWTDSGKWYEWHETKRKEYIVVDESGERVGDAYETAREARVERDRMEKNAEIYEAA